MTLQVLITNVTAKTDIILHVGDRVDDGDLKISETHCLKPHDARIVLLWAGHEVVVQSESLASMCVVNLYPVDHVLQAVTCSNRTDLDHAPLVDVPPETAAMCAVHLGESLLLRERRAAPADAIGGDA